MLVAHEGEQQVLGPDVGVIEDSRLLGRALDRVAGRLREAMQTARRLVVLGDPPRADSGLDRREIDRRAGDHVGRDLEHAEQQVLGRDDVLAVALDVLQGGFEDRDVLPNGHERPLGALDQAGQALLHDLAVDDTDRARDEIRASRARARCTMCSARTGSSSAWRAAVSSTRRAAATQAARLVDAGDELLVEQGEDPLARLRGSTPSVSSARIAAVCRGRGEQHERECSGPIVRTSGYAAARSSTVLPPGVNGS